MNVRCPNCEREIHIPKEYADKSITCPGCKSSVSPHVSEQRPGKEFPVLALITLVVGIAVGFTCATLMKTPDKANEQPPRQAEYPAMKEHNAELARLEAEAKDELARLEAEVSELKERVEQEAMDALQSEQPVTEKPPLAPIEEPDVLISKQEWTKMGFPKFTNIPAKGNIPQFRSRPSVGDFGGVSSVKVVQVLDSDDMLAEFNWSAKTGIDPTLARIKGFSTEGLVDGQRWSGYMRERVSNGLVQAEIAIVGTWSYANTLGSKKTVLAAIPLDFIRWGLTRKEFEESCK